MLCLKIKKRWLARILVLIFVITSAVISADAFGGYDEDDVPEIPITLGGESVKVDGSTPQCYFTADEDRGYTFTVKTKDYILINAIISEFGNSKYHLLNPDAFSTYGQRYGEGEDVEYTFSFNGYKDTRYACFFDIIYPHGAEDTPIEVSLSATDLAGFYKDYEYWSDGEKGKEAASIMYYSGNEKVVSVPESINGIKVDTIYNDVLSGNEYVETLKISEGIVVIRNNVACNCPNLKRVELPSTLDYASNRPFRGCILDEIAFPEGQNNYSWENDCLINWHKYLVGYYGNQEDYTVADGIERVGALAFEDSPCRILRLPDSVKEVYYNRHYFDEIHAESSFCEISERQFYDEESGEPLIGSLYAKHNSYFEKQAQEHNIPFVLEGGEAQQYYEVEESSEALYPYLPDYPVYQYAPDGRYYGTFVAKETGKYYIGKELDFIKDEEGNEISFSPYYAEQESVHYSAASLQEGHRYYFCFSLTDEEKQINSYHIHYDIRIKSPTGVKAFNEMYYIYEVIAGGTYCNVPWAIEEDGTLHIGEDGQSYSMVRTDESGNEMPLVKENRPWNAPEYIDLIKHIEVHGTVTPVGDISGMFAGQSKAEFILIDGLDTSQATSMAYMFKDCSTIDSLDVTGLDTSAATSLEGMFMSCKGVTILNLSGFDLTHLPVVTNMLAGCNNLSYVCLGPKTVTDAMLGGPAGGWIRCELLDGTEVNSPAIEGLLKGYDGSAPGWYTKDWDNQPEEPSDAEPYIEPYIEVQSAQQPAEIRDLPSVKISKPKAEKKKTTIKWKKISKKNLKKIRKVEIQYSPDKYFKTGVVKKYANAKKTSYKLKGLKKGKKYYVRIRAYTASGSAIHVSGWSKTKSVKAK